MQSRPGDDPCLSRPGSMSAEDPEGRAAADDGSSGGSGSPSPGDTLPWNLGKTQRSRRSGGGPGGNGSVLDPAERAVIRIAGNASPPAAAPCRGSRASNPRRPPLWRHLPLLRGQLRPARRAPRSGCRAADGGGALVAQLSEGWRLGEGKAQPEAQGRGLAVQRGPWGSGWPCAGGGQSGRSRLHPAPSVPGGVTVTDAAGSGRPPPCPLSWRVLRAHPLAGGSGTEACVRGCPELPGPRQARLLGQIPDGTGRLG